MKVVLDEKDSEAVEQMGLITECELEEVLVDALRTYLWVIHEETCGNKIVSVDNGKITGQIEKQIVDRFTARRYFKDLGWPVPAPGSRRKVQSRTKR